MTEWHTQTPPVQLRENEVHLWMAPFPPSPEKLSYFESILSADEKKRVRRFRKISDGERHVVARGSLRLLLGSYRTGAPDRLQFTYGPFGKPILSNQSSSAVLNFSVAHSEDGILLGFTRGPRIGVDLEYVRPNIDLLVLAKAYFSPDEFAQLRRLPVREQCEAFYCAWTRKEAYLKACGEGLSFGLERVEVSFILPEPPIIRKVAGVSNVCANWTLKHLSPEKDYLGAAAVEGRRLTFKCFRLPPD